MRKVKCFVVEILHKGWKRLFEHVLFTQTIQFSHIKLLKVFHTSAVLLNERTRNLDDESPSHLNSSVDMCDAFKND